MSKLLTTGQMIDQLKVGEVAVSENNKYLTKAGIIHNYSILPCDENGTVINDTLFLNRPLLENKWIIQPNYISFVKAMQALEKGKSVRWHSSDGADSVVFLPEDYEEEGENNLSFKELMNGKWTKEVDE